MKFACAVVICLLGCFCFSVAFGCIYTVRDVGFADVGSVPYRLYYYIRDDTPEELTSIFKQISYAALMDSNVEVEIINVDLLYSAARDQKEPALDSSFRSSLFQRLDHEASNIHSQKIKHLDFWGIKSFPAAILVSPTGRSLVLHISVPSKPFKETVWSVLDDVVTSPKREEILSSAIKSYCVVLLIQGEERAENEKVRKTVDDAIEELSMIMSQMPRSIEEPPRLIVITSEMSRQERILLWSLGLGESTNVPTEPYVAVLYGRGRRIGNLLEGEEITTDRIFNILSVIGQSCECGLDKRWLLGTMIPLRWGEKSQSEAAKHLGFDPESPVVKTEMSQILSTGSVGDGSTRWTGKASASPLEEYSEEVVDLEGGLNQAAISPAQFRQLVSPEVSSHLAIREAETHVLGMFGIYRAALFIIGGMTLLILAGGAFIILRARRRML